MTHPNFVTNGSSLEDCHTNFFALADLCGIKWRRLTSFTTESSCVDPLEDPVLKAYSKCLTADLLCVWRRVKTSTEPNGRQFFENQFNYKKELWIFWYGEEPDLNDISNELTEEEQGSWETGLSYECRTLLFKALHNLIEKCLLSRGFARLGRWFFQPSEPSNENQNVEQSMKNNKPGNGTQLTFAFNFFVHGDSTVCANVDVRQHPSVYRITKADLQTAQSSQNGTKVILGPYGMAGVITGQSYKDTDHSVQKLLNDWKQVYPITSLASTSSNNSSQSTPQSSSLPQHFSSEISSNDFTNSVTSNSVNRVVEVIVSGFRMKYPFCYVFTTDVDHSGQKTRQSNSNKTNSESVSSNTSEVVSTDNTIQLRPLSSYQHQIPTHTYLLKNCITKELHISHQTSQLTKNKDFNEESDSNLKLWNITDPCSKNNCTCFRCKAKKGVNASKSLNSNMSLNQISSVSKKGDKSDKESKMKAAKVVAPFHRRSPIFDSSVEMSAYCGASSNSTPTSQTVSTVTTNPSVSSSISQPTSVPTYSYKSPISAGGLPSLQSTATTPTGGNGIESPHSISQSVNLDGHSSVGDQTNLSLSPHHNRDESNANYADSQVMTNSGLSPLPNNREKTRLEQLLSPNQHSLKGSVNQNNISDDSPSIGINQWTPGTQSSDIDSAQVQTSGVLSGTTAVHSNQANSVNSNINGVKRPALAISTFEDNEIDTIRNGLLYDYSHLYDITNFCGDIPQPKNRRMQFLNSNDYRRGSSNDIYFNSRKRGSPGSQLTNGEYNDCQLHKKPKDPYEFSDFDEGDGPYKAAQNGVKEEIVSDVNLRLDSNISSPEVVANCNSQSNKDVSKTNLNEVSVTSPQNTKVFIREEELVASYSDLDQIFDTSSGEDSNDAQFHAPLTPSGTSNRNNIVNGSSIAGITNLDEHSLKNNKNSSTCIALGVAELTRMFPTPPSLEPMAPSPCNTFIGPDATIIDDNNKYEIYPCSPISLESSKDWSYVYKPPIQSIVITSTKYAPLQNIPNLPALPADCYYRHSLPNSISNNNQQFQAVSKPQMNQLQHKSTSNHYNHLAPHKQNPNYMSHSQQMSRPGAPQQSSNFQYPQMAGLNSKIRQNMSPVQMNAYQQMQVNNSNQHLHHAHQPHVSQSQQSLYMTMEGMSVSQQTPSLQHYHPSNVDNSIQQPHCHYQSFPPNHRSPLSSSSPLPSMQFNIQSQQNTYISRNNLHDNSSVSLFPEAHSLSVNLLLSDSMLNLFKDHNFESCSICVCNMNTKGNDVGVYLPESQLQNGYEEAQYRCTCGFSAVVNRHRSHYAGLFYEDEVDITGVIYDPCNGLKKKNLANIECTSSVENGKDVNECDQSIIELLISLSTNVLSSCSVLSRSVQYDIIDKRRNYSLFNFDKIKDNSYVDMNSMRNPFRLSYKDGSDVTFGALVTAKLSNENQIPNKHLMLHQSDDQLLSKNALHEWHFKTTKFPVNNLEVIGLLKLLQPLMQESVQRKKTKMWEVTYTVSGPLTWRQFHRLAGRGTEDQCEPQPIPSLLVGYDKDCVALSPFALKYWEKLSLEPYSVTRDIAYIVVSPENDYILSHVKTFFRELSTTYETLKLGKHCPIAKVLRDGILRVGTRTAKKLMDEPIDEWFNQIGDGSVATKLKMYAQACRYHLAPHLSTQTLDKSLFESNQVKQSNESTNANNVNNSSAIGANNSLTNKPSTASPMPNSDTNDKSGDENQNDSSGQHSQQQPQQQSQNELDQDEDPHKQPAIVIYIIEPFTFGSNDKDLYRLSSVGLLRCYTQILRYLPENMKNSIHLQLISLDSLLCNGKDSNNTSRQDQLKDLAFSVFSQCRQQLLHQNTVKSLTGFGPAAMYDLFLKSKDPSSNISRIFTSPFILAPLKDKQTELGEMFGDRREKSQILYCCYCLTEDQRWLLASCTNDKGDILETTCINIEIPNRTRRRKASVRKFGLDKLMRFILTVIAESVQPWRLVIGRLGRIGHGELKDWTFLLSKKSLLKYSRQLRDLCTQCSFMSPFDQPAIFSACLISLEADTALRVFPDHYTPDERFSSSCNTCSLSTPEDASCTHILVFPTSATTQSSHASFSIDPLGANLEEDDLLQALDEAVEDDINVNDIFQWTESPPQSPGLGSPHRDGLSRPDSPGNRHTGYGGSGSMKTSNMLGVDMQDEPTQLLQQPLALAFYVSTARTGPLPRWFWSSCPHMENSCPVFLKSALLIHTPSVQQNSDDILHSNIRNYHSLDSNLTTDVLRCVLEGYNALSWLSLDPSTHDRSSCLPIHIQLLMQLYHSVQAFV